ncbi:MAG: winged helix-turn-helix transcriptional regulator [Candidatus Aenigmarchaeota archaeon]|nr:winged helix-turn-helix transcriptional regulator [Candidatus Aenigmarchaeota archaeon]
MEITKKTIKALASDTRLEILKILLKRRMMPTEISRTLDLAPSTISEHLKKLEEAGLIKKRDTGHKWIYYEITEKGKNLVHPKTPVQFILILSLGFLMMIIGGVYSFVGKMEYAAREMAPTISKGTEGTKNVVQYTGSRTNWIGIIILAIGIILIVIGLYKMLKKK